MRLSLKSKITVNNFFRIATLSLIFLAALNFIDRYFYCVYLAFFVMLVTPKRRLRFSYSSIFLLGLAISMLIFDPDSRNGITSMLKPFIFFIAYTMGLSFLGQENSLEEDYTFTRNIIYAVAGGAFVHFALNLVINWGSLSRNTIDFWTQSVLGATGQACLACICVGIIAAFLFSNVTRKQKLLALGLLAVILVYNLVLAGRTLLSLMIIMCVVAFLYKNVTYKREIIKNTLLLLAAVILVLILYNMDFMEIKTSFEQSNFYARFWGEHDEDLFGNIRLESKKIYLQNMLDYPFGGNQIKSQYKRYAHDLYLDTYDESGIFAFSFIVAYMIASIVRLVQCVKSERMTFEMKQLILCVYVVINIQFWLEPIMQGMPWLFASYCIIDGTVSYLLHKERLIKSEGNKIECV